MRQHAPGLGDESAEAREQRGERRIERTDDEHVAGRRWFVRADVHRAGSPPAAGASTAVAAGGVDGHDGAVDGQAERRGQWRTGLGSPAEVDGERSTRLDEAGELVEAEVDDCGGTVEHAPVDQYASEGEGGAGRQLLHPPGPQPQRLPHRRLAAARGGGSGQRGGGWGEAGLVADGRREQTEQQRVLGDEIEVVGVARVTMAELGEQPKCG